MAFDAMHAVHSTIEGRSSVYFPTLDGLRFVAFLLVFVHHLPRSSLRVLGFLHDQGWVGVHIFFALSAFLLTRILLLEEEACGRLSIRRFYIRRCLRLWPLYLFFCTGIFLYVILSGSWVAGHTGRYLGLMTFVDNIVTSLTWYNPLPWTAHLWTVSVEEQFYLVFPLLLPLALKSPRRLMAWLVMAWGVFIGLRAISVFFQAAHPFIWTSLFAADAFLLGTAVGIMRWCPSPAGPTRGALFIGAIAGCFVGGVAPPPEVAGAHQVFLYAFVAVGAALVLVLALHEPWLRFLAARPLSYLGKISYGLYVFHFLGIHLAGFWQGRVGIDHWWFHSMVALAITIAFAAASYRLVEKPFLNLKLKYEAVHTRPV